jgi:hypothetical protein
VIESPMAMIFIGLAVLNWVSTSSPRAIVQAPKINRQNLTRWPKRRIIYLKHPPKPPMVQPDSNRIPIGSTKDALPNL